MYMNNTPKKKSSPFSALSNSVKCLASYVSRRGSAYWTLTPSLNDKTLPPHAIVIAVAGTKEEIDIALDAVRKIEELQKQRKASEN